MFYLEAGLVVMRHDSEQQVCFTDTATYRYMKEIEKVIHGPYYLNQQIVRRYVEGGSADYPLNRMEIN